MSNDPRRLLAFGPFELHRNAGLLFRAGERVALPPKVLHTLVVLVEHPGQLLSKDELMKAIWPDTFVEEQNLTLNIHALRKVLNAGGTGERYIETVPRRGYRFIASVSETSGAPAVERSASVAPTADDDAATVRPARTPHTGRGLLWGAPAVVSILVVSGIAASRLLAHRTDLDAGPELLRLTDNIAEDWQPDVSPDGRSIVFASNRDGGKGEIYAMDADGSHPRNLTNNPANDDTPAWSPDGRRIAFQSDRRGPIEIFVMDADGRNPTPVTRGARAAWSPDNRRIAYQVQIDGHSEISIVDVSGGAPHRLTFDRSFAADPSWSPDGTRLAFTSKKGSDLQVDVMRLDGSGRTTLTSAGNNSLPAWSPDGERLLFDSDRDGVAKLYVMNADGTVQHAIDDRQGSEGGWWPTGHAVVLESDRDGNGEIYRLRLAREPDGALRLTRNVATDDYPVWSPDGRSIAFESNRDGKPNIFVMGADGEGARNLSRSASVDRQPAWSADGRLAFASERGGGSAIYVMNADGTGARRVSDGTADWAPHWSADGTSICFSRKRGIWTTPSIGGTARRIASGETCAWSPDGRDIIYDRDESGAREIYSAPAAGGGGETCLSRNGRGNGGPVWSFDASRIAFNSNQDGFGFGIFVMNRDGTAQTRLTGRRTFDEHPAWSPDGAWIAFSSDRDGNKEIYKVRLPAR
ncbi:MAG: winged helix-turn-helix domain-containing protein [Vicinamibacterales bacterium]